MQRAFNIIALSFVLALGVGACKNSSTSAEAVRHFSIHGKVMGFQAEGKVVVLKHDKVEGLMEGMTMGFEKAPGVGEGLKVGDMVNGTLTQSDDSYILTELKKQ